MSETGEKSRAFISIEEGLSDNQRSNLNISVGLLSFSTMIFHFAAVYFFTLQLGSLAMVGIFLGLGNFFAFLFDVPIGILQKYFKAKTLLMFGAVSQIIAMVIFANFIFGVSGAIVDAGADVVEEIGVIKVAYDFFIGEGLNFILLLLASICYGFTREVNDITLLSYVLNNANPSQYKSIIAQNNLFFGVGSLFGLILSGVILTFAPELILFCIIFIIGGGAFISLKFFDSKDKLIKLSDIKRFKVYFDKGGMDKAKKQVQSNLEEAKQGVYDSVSSVDLKATLGKTKYIFMRPVTMKTKMIGVGELVEQTRTSFIDIYKTLQYASSKHLIVYWSFSMVLAFGFWDTFASTFLIDFLDELKPGWSYVLLGLIAVPAFATQDLFGKISDKMGPYLVANVGLAISGTSLVMMALFGSDVNFMVFLVLALANSIGYAICMSLSVAVFLESYNKTYAEKNNLTEIDSNASAAPMKILQNLANVVGLIFGGMILKVAGYTGFFAIFGTLVLGFLGWSIWKKKEVKS